MEKEITRFELTRLSSKGQLVIPQNVRNHVGIKEGNMLAVASYNGLVVLKKVNAHISEQDLRTLKLVDEAWEDIENGKYRQLSRQEFLNKLKEW